MDKPRLLKEREARLRVNVSRSKMYALIASGELPSIRLGPRSVRIPEEALDLWMTAKLEESLNPLGLGLQPPRREEGS